MQRLVWWVQWHRRLGAVVAVLVCMLAVTGILINHSQDMGWHRKPVFSTVLAWLYGIPRGPVEHGFAVADHWITQAGDRLYLDTRAVHVCSEPLLGAVALDDMLAVLCGARLSLLDGQGGLIEQLTNVPAQPRALAVQEGRLLLETGSGTFAYRDDSGEWSALETSVKPAHPRPLPPALREQLVRRNPVPGLSWERVLLDLHSGRLFGKVGVLVVDLVGVATALLAFSGLLTWVGRKRRHRKRH